MYGFGFLSFSVVEENEVLTNKDSIDLEFLENLEFQRSLGFEILIKSCQKSLLLNSQLYLSNIFVKNLFTAVACKKKNWLHLPLKIFASVLYCSSVFFLHKYHTLPCSINILYNEWPGRSKCKFFICSAKISCWTPDGHLTDQSTNQLIADISQGPSCQTQSFTYTLNFILRLYYFYFFTVDEGATKVLFAFFTLTNTEKLVKYAYIF